MYLRPLSLSGKKMIITTDDNSGKILNALCIRLKTNPYHRLKQ